MRRGLCRRGGLRGYGGVQRSTDEQKVCKNLNQKPTECRRFGKVEVRYCLFGLTSTIDTTFVPPLRLIPLAAAFVLTTAGFGSTQARYIDGVFVATSDGISELIAYAERRNNGSLEMTSGSLEDVPSIREVRAPAER